jgi:glycosyltransferase involved in cell wall biosynthesis
MAPTVTVVIPVHDRARYLGAAIDSVLAQTFTDFELIVADDGSTDGSDAIAAGYADPRVRLLRNGTNLGAPATRNRAIAEARGRYVANLDSDDLMRADRLARQVAFLDAHPDIALLGSDKGRIDSGGRRMRKLRRRPTAPAAVAARLLFRCCIAHTSMMARTAVLRDHPYDTSFPVSQDFDLFTRIAERHAVGNLPEPLVLYRRHATQVSLQHARTRAMQTRIMARQLDRLGVAHDDADLANHALLARPRTQNVPTRAYLAWARDWLHRLEAANAAAGVHEAEAFRRVLGEVWLAQCLKAAPAVRPAAVWSTLARADLRGRLRDGLRGALSSADGAGSAGSAARPAP